MSLCANDVWKMEHVNIKSSNLSNIHANESHCYVLPRIKFILYAVHTIPHLASNALHNLVLANAADSGYLLIETKSSV